MRNRIILLVGGPILILGVVSLYFVSSASLRSKPTVGSIDNKGIYVGSGKSGLEPVPNEASQFNRTVKALNEGWDNIGIGETYYRSGQYEEAIQAYKKAYDVDPGNRVLSGDKLIKAYEKLSRYDEAIAVVDEILKNERLAQYGVEQFTAIRTRLLAAKAAEQAVNKSQPTPSQN